MDKKPLHVLLVEDDPNDAELMLRELRRAGFEPEWKRVDTEAEFSAHLDPALDIILSDYAMPQFSGFHALELLKKCALDIPFILVSGTIGEDVAVKAMRNGATDYLLKDRLARLGQSVENALDQKRIADERRQAQEAVEKLTRRHELILNSAGEGICGVDSEGKITFANPKAAELLGWQVEELLGKPAHETIHAPPGAGGLGPAISDAIADSMRNATTRRVTNDVFYRKGGRSFRADYVCAPTEDEQGTVTGCIVTFKDATEQFMADARLKLQEHQYRLLFETNPNPMWVFNTESLRILAVNQAAIAQYGYSRDEFVKLTLKDLRPDEDLPDLAKSLSSSSAPPHFSGEFRHKRKDGSLIAVEIYSGPIVWEGVGARIVTAIDITERNRVQEELRSTHQQLRELLAHTPAVIYSLRIDGQTIAPTFVSDNVERLLGVTAADACRYEWWDASLHPDDRDRVLETVSKSLIGGGEGYSMQYRLRAKDGNYRWIEDNNRLLRDQIGQVKEVVGVFVDITERRRAEERLREQADIINRAHDAVIIRDFVTERVTFWNSGAERLFGWSASEATGRPIGELIFPSEEVRRPALKVLLSVGEFHGELKQMTKDGREITVDGRATIIRDADGAPRSVLLIHTDITEQKKLEMQLLRAQRLESIGTLASGVAHDLNNILTPILMCAEVLRRAPRAEDLESSISLIEESARRGAAIVKQVLTFARGVEGERVLIKSNHLIEEMVDIARRTFPKSIDIESKYPEDLWSIEGDPTQLHQVLLNLSVNARDAMPNGGRLVIAAENLEVDENYAAMTPDANTGSYVMLRISDSGQGMPRSVIDQIFDPFFTTKEIGKGTGLGLSTALGIVKSHGGFISVYSEVGQGTTFKVFLPAKLEAGELRAPASAMDTLKGNGELVLVVDDEPSIVRVSQMILEAQNYRVISASDGPEALATFAQQMNSIRAVLTDIMLPHMDGVALIRAMKKMKPDMMFIASTGQGEQVRASELETLGVGTFLTKPYDSRQLLGVLHEALT